MVPSSNKPIIDLERQRLQELLRIAASTTKYYDSLTNDQAEEDRDWGLVAAAQLTSESS